MASAGQGSQRKIFFFDDSDRNRPKADKLTEAQLDQIEFVKIASGIEGKVGKFQGVYFGSGINSKQMKDVLRKIRENRVAALVFDWDRTLTLFEGIPAIWRYPRSAEHPVGKLVRADNLDELLERYKEYGLIDDRPWTLQRLAKFLLEDPGDPERVGNLGKLLREAQKKNIPIFILTNNSIVIRQKKLLTDILWYGLDIEIPPEQVFGSGSKWSQTKGETIIHNILPITKGDPPPAIVPIVNIELARAFYGSEAAHAEPLTENEVNLFLAKDAGGLANAASAAAASAGRSSMYSSGPRDTRPSKRSRHSGGRRGRRSRRIRRGRKTRRRKRATRRKRKLRKPRRRKGH